MDAYDDEQRQLCEEVVQVTKEYKQFHTRVSGLEICKVIGKFLKPHLPAGWTVSEPDVYIREIGRPRLVQWDLLLVRSDAQPERHGSEAIYEPQQVGAALEIKATGIRDKKDGYKEKLGRLRKNFQQVRDTNPEFWGVLLTVKGTISPAKRTAIDYENIRKDTLESDYGVFTLRNQRSEIQYGAWQAFTREILRHLQPGLAMKVTKPLSDSRGRFGEYGGRFVPETLMAALEELEAAYRSAQEDAAFQAELVFLLKHYAGRPTPLYHAANLSRRLGGAQIYLKREDLAHTGAHKINNALGQGLLARRMGKRRIIAETGAGQHGVAAATVCAMLGMECIVYMGEEDMRRQAPNVYRMRLLGAEVRPVSSGTRTLKDAINETIRDWVTNVETTHYLLGSAVGPHPYPMMVRDFQSVIGSEARTQILEAAGRLPDYAIACVGGGSNAIGLFYPLLADESVRLVGVEAGGEGIETGKHAATLVAGKPGVLHGSFSYLLQDDDGQVRETHSVSAGLDYPGVGPEHSYLKDIHRATYIAVTDAQALEGFRLLCRTEGIIPALEPAHAIAYVAQLAPTLSTDVIILVCLSGRGDKDLQTVQEST